MKKFFYLFAASAFLSFMLLLAEPGLPGHSGIGKNHPYNKKESNGILLVYSGSIKSPHFSYDIGIHFEVDTSIGVSYQVVFERGANVLSHIAIFYKFSKPNQATIYNYLTRQSSISYNNSNTVGDPDVEVVGSEMMDQYSCTHLQNLNKDGHHISKDDFWMCANLPGFQALTKILNQLNSGTGSLAFSGTIFNWGVL